MLSGRLASTRNFICKRVLSFGTLIVIVLLIHATVGQDIAFPDENPTDVLQRKNANPETTLTLPQIVCGENMILYKFNATEMFCECAEGYLYYASLDNCYKQYTRGPCDVGKYFILRSNVTMAKCTRNPCKTENEIPYKGSCYGLLLSGGPCAPDETLVVSEKSYEPACEIIDTFSYHVITVPIKAHEACPAGSRRAGRGLCRTIL